jgi:hypothetical protein
MNYGRRVINPSNRNMVQQENIQKERKGQIM